jgi:ribosomal protein S12 methylthiotransferase RimO
MQISVGMVSLGCVKNQVDAEMLMAQLEKDGFILKDDAAMADVAIVNTCGFIDSAKQEAVEEILELAKLKDEGRIKKIVVTGCLAERYKEEIHNELPEIDAVVGIGGNSEIGKVILEMMDTGFVQSFPDKTNMPLCGERVLSTPSYFAYIKIAEGCDNCCTYCAIPSIRGGFRSRTIESIEEEAKMLAENGAKEIILIAQDTTRYGMDIYGEYSLAKLLKRLAKIESIHWIRTLYCYPEAITDELLDVMASEEKVVKYLDLPLQHADGKVLKRMNRQGDRASLTALISKIRSTVPGVTLRTTFIVGFPGESEENFTELAEFVKEIRFDRMGCFAYSQEDGTPAATMPEQIDDEVKMRRAEILMQNQMDIMQEKGEAMIGQKIEVLTEAFDRYAECWFGRSSMDAPDVDGKIFFSVKDKKPTLGEIVQVEITDCIDCDLFGEMI